MTFMGWWFWFDLCVKSICMITVRSTNLVFEWLLRFKSLLCRDEVGDDGERGEFNKWCDSIGSPCTGWWSSSIRSSIWLRLNVAASDTTSGIYSNPYESKRTVIWKWLNSMSGGWVSILPCQLCLVMVVDDDALDWICLKMNSPTVNCMYYYCYYYYCSYCSQISPDHVISLAFLIPIGGLVKSNYGLLLAVT